MKKVLMVMLAVFMSGVLVAEDLSAMSVADQQAEVFYKQKKPASMAQVYYDLAQQNSGSDTASKALQEAGRICVNWGLYDQAENEFDAMKTMFGADSDQAGAMALDMGQEYTSKRHCQKAIEKFRYVLDNSPTQKQRLLARGHLALAHSLAGDADTAQAELDTLLTQFAECSSEIEGEKLDKVIFNLGERFCQLGQDELAQPVYLYNANRFCADGKAAHMLSYRSMNRSTRYYIEKGDYVKIESLLSGWVAKCSDPADKSAAVHSVAKELGKTDKAKAAALFQQNVTDYPGQEHALKSQARLNMRYATHGPFEQADAGVQKLLTDYPAYPDQVTEEVFRAAKHFLWSSQHERALSLAGDLTTHETLSAVPASAYWARIITAVEAVVSGDETGALSQINEAKTVLQEVGLAASSQKAAGRVKRDMFVITNNYRKQGGYTEALAMQDFCLSVFPEMMYFQLEKALCYIELGDYTAVQASADKLIADYKDREKIEELLCLIGEKLHEKGNDVRLAGNTTEADTLDREAITVWEKTINNLPDCSDHPHYQYYLGAAHYYLKEYGKALEYFDKAEQWGNYKHAYDVQLKMLLIYRALKKEELISVEDAEALIVEKCNTILQSHPDTSSEILVKSLLKKYVQSGQFQ